MGEDQYYKQSIDILLDRNSEVFQRLEELAVKTGKPIEELLDWAMGLGVYEHLHQTIRVLERIHENIE